MTNMGINHAPKQNVLHVVEGAINIYGGICINFWMVLIASA
jgi:hypothetical protein